MSMRCNLLGHSLGEVDVRTASNEDESGDIDIQRKVRVCERCDHEEVVSENKSVRVSESTETQDSVDETPTISADGGDGGANTDSGLGHGYDSEQDDALIMGSDSETETTEESPDETVESNEPTIDTDSEDGVAFIEHGPSEPTESDESEEESDSEEDGSLDPTSGGALFIENGPSEPTESDESEEPTTDESTSTGSGGAMIISNETESSTESGSEQVETEESKDNVEQTDQTSKTETGKTDTGNAVVWSGSSSNPDTSSTEGTDTELRDESPSDTLSRQERHQKRQQEKSTSRVVRTDGKDVVCTECDFRQNQYQANMVAGDACPECRKAYLTWYEESE